MAMVVGCDLHVRFQQLAVADTASGELQEVRLENEPLVGVREFYRRFPAPATVVMEATGYGLWFAQLMAELGHELVVGDPARLRAMAVRKQKTDRRDALHLVEVYRRGDFPRVRLASLEQIEIRNLLRHRHLLVRLRRSLKMALQAVAMNRGLRHRHALWTRAGRERFEALELLPWESRRRQECLALVADLDERIAALDQAVEARAAAEPLACRLRVQPGVGPVTALAWVAIVGDVSRFPTSNHLCSYVGLNPSEHSSGGRQRLGHIGKQGNRFLRHLLVEAAQTAGRLDPELARFYRRKLAAKGHGTAVVAVARKLAVRMYWMAKRSARDSESRGAVHADLPDAVPSLQAMASRPE